MPLRQEVAEVIQYVTFLFLLSQGSTGPRTDGRTDAVLGVRGAGLNLAGLKVTAFFFLHNNS